MKKSNNIILFFVLISLTILMAVFPVSALASKNEDPGSRIYDRDNCLPYGDSDRIYEYICNAENAMGAVFLIAVFDAKYGIPDEYTILDYFGFTTDDNLVLLVIEYDADGVNCYEMFTYGRPHRLISGSAVDRILDNGDVYHNIKGNDLTAGAIAFIQATAYEMQDSEKSIDLVKVVISIAAGIIAVVVVIVIYKTKLKSPVYPLSEFTELKLTERQDYFVGKTVSRVKIESSSGSSSGGSSGGGSRGRR